MLPKTLAFVDIETTGTGATYDRIIEIGILRIENGILVKTYKSLVNPQSFVSPFITEMTGITQGELENAPTFRQIKDDVLEILKDATFVAHNVRFDLGFFKNEFKRHDISFAPKHFCTVKLSRHLYPRFTHHNLDSIIKRFKINCESRHRAFDDARVLWEFYKRVHKKFGEEKLASAIETVMKKPAIPLKLAASFINDQPEGPGVYIFYGANKTPLYIGKSVNIRNRILSHFTSDHQTSRQMNMCQQIEDIETIKTSGELGALLLESMLIKKKQPLFNQQLRLSQKLVSLKKSTDENGFHTARVEIVDRIDPFKLSEVLGIFKTQRQVKEFLLLCAKEYFLCYKLLNLEKTKKACFAYHLEICKGACVGRETSLKYNMRFAQAFSKKSIKPWPFKGPVIIEDKDVLDKSGEAFLVDKWCFLGSIRYDEQSQYSQDNTAAFDRDTYKILLRFLKNKKNWRSVRQITPEQLSAYFPSQNGLTTMA
ncbi:MAG TPA: exonuclease domain-containing protein [Candidatus Saccharimonadales bacterium]|nr:exonuclease domain-containing protein [Candidatus Saccharimonadales bacterium]